MDSVALLSDHLHSSFSIFLFSDHAIAVQIVLVKAFRSAEPSYPFILTHLSICISIQLVESNRWTSAAGSAEICKGLLQEVFPPRRIVYSLCKHLGDPIAHL